MAALASLALPAAASAQPTAPSGLRATEGLSDVALSWQAATPGAGEAISGYEVLEEGARIATTDGYTTNLLVTGLSPGAKRSFSVVALAGSNRSPASQPLEVQTASAASTIEGCQSTPLGAGHYVLGSDLVMPPSQSCITFESAQGVSLECANHSITDEPTTNGFGDLLKLKDVTGFLIANCSFYNPEALYSNALLASVVNSSAGTFANDAFGAGSGTDGVSLSEDSKVAFDSNTFTNATLGQVRSTEDYFGFNTLTQPGQGAGEPFEFQYSTKDTVDGNSIDGDSNLKGYEAGLKRHWYPEGSVGADDVMLTRSDAEDTIANNQLLSSFDCGFESTGLAAHDRFINNVIDNAWATGFCSYWATSYLEDVFSGNTVAHSGSLVVLAGSRKELAKNPQGEAEPRNYLYRNTFEGNRLVAGGWHIWNNSVFMTPWSESALEEPLQVGENRFTGNDFGESLPAPYINAKAPEKEGEYPPLVEPLIIGSQSGNQCSLPSPYIECASPALEAPLSPSVVALYPDQGPIGGGGTVAIEGSGLDGATEVRFGTRRATIKDVVEDSRMLVEAPPGEGSGTVSVSVVTASGTSKPTADATYSYGDYPAVTSLSPVGGPGGGGTTVTITGTNLSGASAVAFGPRVEHSCEVSASPCFTVTSSSSITAVSEPSADGVSSVNVTVTTPAGTSPTIDGIVTEQGGGSSDSFWYLPSISSISPRSGAESGGTNVKIVGEHLDQAESVWFGSAEASNIHFVGASIIEATAPPGKGTVDVTVRNPAGTSATSEADRFYYGSAVVSRVTPESGPLAGGRKVTIVGEHFEEVQAVYFGGAQATEVDVLSPTELTAVAPAGSGEVYVTVRTGAGTSATGPGSAFLYLATPVLTGLSPQSGPEAAGSAVTIYGEGFQKVESVKFGAKSARSFLVTSPTSISAVAPAGSGTVDVSVTTGGGTTAKSSADRYVYQRSPILAWGSNNRGELGNGTLEGQLHVAGSSEVPGVTQVAAGDLLTLELGEGGRVFAFGANSEGDLGDGKSGEASQSTPVAVCAPGEQAPCSAQLAGVSALAAGQEHAVALRQGKVYAWGANQYGQLGNGTTAASDTPVEVGGLPEEAIAVAAGGDFSLALLKGGSVYSWGENDWGQLGDGRMGEGQYDASPAPVQGLAHVKAIAAGGSHSYALLENGTVMAWGEDFGGDLGANVSGNQDVPVQVQDIAEGEVIAISAGYADGMALTKSHAVRTWGWNAMGELGDGSKYYSAVPVSVKGLSEEVTAISAGGFYDMALTKAGKVMAWGDNLDGELADGKTNGPEHCITEWTGCTRVAVEVAGLEGVSAISAGEHYGFALRDVQIPTVSSISPASGPEGGGSSVTISGSNLAQASEVRFGTQAATNFSVSSSGESIAATAPPGAGEVDVRVATPQGLSAPVPADRFSYRMSAPEGALALHATVQSGSELVIAIPKEGGFSFGPLLVSGSVGEAAKLQIQTPGPAFETLKSGEYRSTGKGIQTTVTGYKSGSSVAGPVLVACSVPATIQLAEIPIASAPAAAKRYSTTYTAECVLAPGSVNSLGSAQVTMSASAPSAVTPGQEVRVSEATFSIVVPKQWRELLSNMGANEVSGSSSAEATAVMVG
ncbi:MAG TPA: IPT/TIG domain-containing protein [Solirubrobacteraceae bacterium]|nr:IPT/TIG domain-containing protein [Solirubrobacteraceae bacterium]